MLPDSAYCERSAIAPSAGDLVVGKNGPDSMSNVRYTPWVAQLCQIPEALHSGNLAIRTAFEHADPDLNDPATAVGMIRRHLDTTPQLVGAWQQYSYDKRASPGPYLDQDEVGFYDDGYQDVQRFDSPVDACAEFIYRESAWVLERRR